MLILHLTDIHSDFEKLHDVISSEVFDLAIISGDITHFGGIDEIKEAFKILDNSNTKFIAITGNCDKHECEIVLNKNNVSADCKVIDTKDYQIAGLSGSLPCPGKTPNEFTEEEIKNKLEQIEKLLFPSKPLIFITHQPPYNTINDKVMMGIHVGSTSIRNFIENNSPILCLTGHIHEGKGIDYIGKCPIINPGPLRNGHYAIIELTGELSPRVQIY